MYKLANFVFRHLQSPLNCFVEPTFVGPMLNIKFANAYSS